MSDANRIKKDPFEEARKAIMKNDVVAFSECLNSIKAVNLISQNQTMLSRAAIYKKKKIFDYLIAHPDIDINGENNNNQTALLEAVKCGNLYYALKLIEKGADLISDKGTLFHWCIDMISDETSDCSDGIALAEAAVKAGLPIDAVNSFGDTGLNYACSVENAEEWIYFFLFHGADAKVPNHDGYLPVIKYWEKPYIDDVILHAILHQFTFDKFTTELGLKTVALLLKSPLYLTIYKNLKKIHYDPEGIMLLFDYNNLCQMYHFDLFMERFPYIVEKINLKTVLKTYIDRLLPINLFKILPVILNNPDALNSIQYLRNCDIRNMAEAAFHYNFPLSKFTNIITIMLSYGFYVTVYDLHYIYFLNGHSELFKLLLHMRHDPYPSLDLQINAICVSFMVVLYYSIHYKLEAIWDLHTEEFCLHRCFNYFATPKKILDVSTTPALPCLLELSRNAAHDFIVSKWKPQTCGEYYAIVKHLPISIDDQMILTFEFGIYLNEEKHSCCFD